MKKGQRLERAEKPKSNRSRANTARNINEACNTLLKETAGHRFTTRGRADDVIEPLRPPTGLVATWRPLTGHKVQHRRVLERTLGDPVDAPVGARPRRLVGILHVAGDQGFEDGVPLPDLELGVLQSCRKQPTARRSRKNKLTPAASGCGCDGPRKVGIVDS